MAEEAVVVNYHSQVCGDELAITCLDERITLDKLRIIDHRYTIEVCEQVRQCVQSLSPISKLQSDLPRVESSHPKHRVEPVTKNLLGTLARNLLDVYSSLIRG